MPWSRGEPSLEEMLRDPTVRAVMRSDGISESVLRALMRDVARARGALAAALDAEARPSMRSGRADHHGNGAPS